MKNIIASYYDSHRTRPIPFGDGTAQQARILDFPKDDANNSLLGAFKYSRQVRIVGKFRERWAFQRPSTALKSVIAAYVYGYRRIHGILAERPKRGTKSSRSRPLCGGHDRIQGGGGSRFNPSLQNAFILLKYICISM